MTWHVNSAPPPGVRDAFDRAVRNFVVAFLEEERDTLRAELPPGLRS